MVEKRDAKRKGWQTVDTTVKELKYTVTPLNEGSLYVFRVAAENAVGLGPFCELEDSVLAKDTFSKLESSLETHFLNQEGEDNKIYSCFSYSRATVRPHRHRFDQEIRGPAVGGT